MTRRRSEVVEYRDGKIIVPDEFADASYLVTRTPWATFVESKNAIQYYNSANEHLNRGQVSFKVRNGEETIYEVSEEFDREQLRLTEVEFE